MEPSTNGAIRVESARKPKTREPGGDSLALSFLVTALVSAVWSLVTVYMVAEGLPVGLPVRMVLSIEILASWIVVRAGLSLVSAEGGGWLFRGLWWWLGATLGWAGLFLCVLAGAVSVFEVLGFWVWVGSACLVGVAIAGTIWRCRAHGDGEGLAAVATLQVGLAVFAVVSLAATAVAGFVLNVVLPGGVSAPALFGPSLVVGVLVVHWLARHGGLGLFRAPSPELARVVAAGVLASMCAAAAALLGVFEPVRSVQPVAVFLANSVYPFAIVFSLALLVFVAAFGGSLRRSAPLVALGAVVLLGLTVPRGYSGEASWRAIVAIPEDWVKTFSSAEATRRLFKTEASAGRPEEESEDVLIAAYWGDDEPSPADRAELVSGLARLEGDDPRRAPILTRLARGHWYTGRCDEAIELLEEARHLATQLSPWEVVLVEGLRARWLAELGGEEEASALARGLAEQLPAGGGSAALWAVADLVMTCTLTGDWWTAEELATGFAHFQSRENRIWRRATAKLQLATAQLMISWGRFAEAEESLAGAERSLAQVTSPWLRQLQRALRARLELLRFGQEQASGLLVAAIEKLEGAPGDGERQLLVLLRERAAAAAAAGDYGTALQDAFWAADLIRDGVWSPKERARTLYVVGTIFAGSGRLSEAETALRNAAETADQLARPHWGLARVWHDLASVMVRRGRVAEATELYEEAQRRAWTELDLVFPRLSEAQRLSATESVALRLQEHLSHLARHGSSEQVRTALMEWSRLRGIVARAQIEERRWAESAPDSEPKDVLVLLKAARTSLTRHWLQKREALALSTNIAGLERDLARLAWEGGVRTVAADVDYFDVISPVRPGVLYLDFARVPRRDGAVEYLAFAVDGSRPDQQRLEVLGTEEDIAAAVVRFYLHLALKTSKSETRVAGRAVYKRLLEPFEGALRRADELVISPDGAIPLVPFPALPFGRDGYLVDHVRTSLVSGLQALDQSGERGKPEDAVVLADPDATARLVAAKGMERGGWSRLGSLDLEPLPGARREGRLLAGMLEDHGLRVRLGIGAEARESMLSEVVSPGVVHIAGHGFFLPSSSRRVDPVDLLHTVLGVMPRGARDDPMARSGMVLAGARESVTTWNHDEGVLTARKVLDLPLRNTALVVLSGCLTGLGDAQTGEGLLGLTRAFLIAGSDAVVVSLWSVDDVTTQQLMFEFYHEWLNGRSPSDALRVAQTHLRRDGLHPHYWAPFVLARNSGN